MHTRKLSSHKFPRHINLTTRDLAIIERIATLRYAKTSQMLNLFGGGSKIRRRLRLLFEHGYLSRTRCKQSIGSWGGSKEIVHCIGKRGVKLLATHSPLPYGRLDWLQRHSKNESVEHGLMISEFITDIELSCANNESMTFIPPFHCKEIIMGKPKHIRWSVQTSEYGAPPRSIGIVPDEVFGIQYGSREPIFFFFEADRGTVPITSRNVFRTSMAKKLIGYHATKETGILQTKWNLSYFKVLILTSSPDRLQNLLEVNHRFNSGSGSGLFLFMDLDTFHNSNNLLTVTWNSGYHNEGIRLDNLNHSLFLPNSKRKNQFPPLPLQWN